MLRHALGLFALLAAAPAFADEVKPFADTSRLVAIGGSLTEIVYALGEENRLVARDSTALYPEAALQLPDIGYMRQLSPEGVLSVNPSALLVLEGSGPPEALDVLSRASVEQVTVPEGYSADGIIEKVRIVGAALGVPDKAAKLEAELDIQLKAAEAATAGMTQKQRVLFILSLEAGKVMASGTGTAADGIIHMAGAENAITAYQGYKTLTDEALIEAAPDVILMMTREGTAITDDELFSQPGIALTPAGKSRKVIRIEGAYLLGFGPRTAAAVEELASDLYGDAVKHP
jgi:iron complex transport system substrate-binding protein